MGPILIGTLFAASSVLPPQQAASGSRGAEHLESLLPGEPPALRAAAFEGAARSGDRRYLAPLVDLLAFVDTPEGWYRILDTLGAILGEDLRTLERPWNALTLRLAADSDLREFPGYAGWKGEVLARLVDPRMREFLFDGVPRRVRLDEIVWGGVEVDGIPALVDAPTHASRGELEMPDEEPVFGVFLGGVARAYPLRVLDWHEMANDTVGGVPVALAYCTLCGAGVLFDRRLGEEVLTFGSSGLLLRSNKLMYDHGTRSLWNQLSGEPVVGPLARSGQALEVLPLVLTTWGAWRERHPGTSVLAEDTGHEREYRLGAAYGAYFASAKTMFPARRAAPRFEDKERVYVVRHQGDASPVRLEDLRREGLVHTRVGDLPVVVVQAGARDEVPLDGDWKELLEPTGADLSKPAWARQLRARDLRRAWERVPALVDARLLLATPFSERAAFLAWAVEERPAGQVPSFPLALRDSIATQALAAETRAFEAGGQRFAMDPGSGVLTDGSGAEWRVEEDALVRASDGTRLARLPGHLAYGFAWDAFFAGEPVTRVPSSR